MTDKTTVGEDHNGWTAAALRRYLVERDDAVNRVHRVGSHAGDPAPMRIISAREAHDEHDW